MNEHQCVACHGSGTRVEVHRSRYELERVLSKFGAEEILFVEADAKASIQFAMHGRYVQLALPLPDPENARFTHTPTGKPRTRAAQDRAYEQALREHWRSLVVAVRGKLQSVESGISTFEQEFDRFLVAGFAADKKRRDRKTPRGVNWLLGGSHSLAIALVAAFLVPASAVGAFALPTNVVGHLAAPFRSAVRDDTSGAGSAADGLALARGGWSPSFGGEAPSADAPRLLAMRTAAADDVEGESRETASLSSPPAPPVDALPAPSTLAAESSTPLPVPQPRASESGNKPAPADPAPASPPAADEAPPPDETPPVIPDEPASDTVVAETDAPDVPPAPATDAPDPSAGNDSAPPDDQTTPNGNGIGNSDGTPPGQGGTPPGQGGTPPGQGGTPPGQANTPPGQANDPPGQANNPPGQGNGQGKGQGNGKPKGGK